MAGRLEGGTDEENPVAPGLTSCSETRWGIPIFCDQNDLKAHPVAPGCAPRAEFARDMLDMCVKLLVKETSAVSALGRRSARQDVSVANLPIQGRMRKRDRYFWMFAWCHP